MPAYQEKVICPSIAYRNVTIGAGMGFPQLQHFSLHSLQTSILLGLLHCLEEHKYLKTRQGQKIKDFYFSFSKELLENIVISDIYSPIHRGWSPTRLLPYVVGDIVQQVTLYASQWCHIKAFYHQYSKSLTINSDENGVDGKFQFLKLIESGWGDRLTIDDRFSGQWMTGLG